MSDASIASRIRSARRAVDDDGDSRAVIRTVHGRGYRFVGNVVETHPARAAVTAPAPDQANPAPVGPSIAILPFRLLSMPPDRAILADAIPDESSRRCRAFDGLW